MLTIARLVKVFSMSFWVTVVHCALMLFVMLGDCEAKKMSLLRTRMMAGVRPSSWPMAASVKLKSCPG